MYSICTLDMSVCQLYTAQCQYTHTVCATDIPTAVTPIGDAN